jgi:transposase
MGSPVTLRSDYDAEMLGRLARRCRDTRQARRFLSLAAIYDGMNRTEAARVGGMDRQTLRDWVIRFNEEGPTDRSPPPWRRQPANRRSTD